MPPPAKTLSAASPAASAFEPKVAAFEIELDFYSKLLSWLLLSCKEEKRHTIEVFRAEVNDLRVESLSVLRSGLNVLKNAADQPGYQSEAAQWLSQFNHLEWRAQSLKASIHRRFSDFAHVCIW